MSNKREPLLSYDEIHELEDQGTGELEWALSRYDIANAYEAARTKDAELIQMLVDDLRLLRIEFGNRVGQTTQIGIASLSDAEAAGYKPTKP
jgi:hypothetical protein